MLTTNTADWQPNASPSALRIRARVLQQIRRFFQEREVLEVETPLLSQCTVTDPYLSSFSCVYHYGPQTRPYYLQTSPEYAMKRLLAAGSGSIFQICKAFRNGGEYGRQHNPEFTMLEWYRIDFDHHQLMQELATLLQVVLQAPNAHYLSYVELFQKFLGIDPLEISCATLARLATEQQITLHFDTALLTHTDWLQLLFTHRIEPQMDPTTPLFVYDFPKEQAALAKLNAKDPRTAARFELYYGGYELANGFYELTDPKEQRARFIADLERRKACDLPTPPPDERLLAALSQGLPDCAGVAVGVDRLVMMAVGATSIQEVLSFDIERA